MAQELVKDHIVVFQMVDIELFSQGFQNDRLFLSTIELGEMVTSVSFEINQAFVARQPGHCILHLCK